MKKEDCGNEIQVLWKFYDILLQAISASIWTPSEKESGIVKDKVQGWKNKKRENLGWSGKTSGKGGMSFQLSQDVKRSCCEQAALLALALQAVNGIGKKHHKTIDDWILRLKQWYDIDLSAEAERAKEQSNLNGIKAARARWEKELVVRIPALPLLMTMTQPARGFADVMLGRLFPDTGWVMEKKAFCRRLGGGVVYSLGTGKDGSPYGAQQMTLEIRKKNDSQNDRPLATMSVTVIFHFDPGNLVLQYVSLRLSDLSVRKRHTVEAAKLIEMIKTVVVEASLFKPRKRS